MEADLIIVFKLNKIFVDDDTNYKWHDTINFIKTT